MRRGRARPVKPTRRAHGRGVQRPPAAPQTQSMRAVGRPVSAAISGLSMQEAIALDNAFPNRK
jgi:hypothetical protein